MASFDLYISIAPKYTMTSWMKMKSHWWNSSTTWVFRSQPATFIFSNATNSTSSLSSYWLSGLIRFTFCGSPAPIRSYTHKSRRKYFTGAQRQYPTIHTGYEFGIKGFKTDWFLRAKNWRGLPSIYWLLRSNVLTTPWSFYHRFLSRLIRYGFLLLESEQQFTFASETANNLLNSLEGSIFLYIGR